ncbi:hypothetical protein [Actinotalea solisilvae]|uniref:hypothetical protein n=1 Tax=Actinotalea solisilvae TaxID=2072922 RepID=UPI0018F25F73|nr:hypothetical protein [Actinotalea solisilvae]
MAPSTPRARAALAAATAALLLVTGTAACGQDAPQETPTVAAPAPTATPAPPEPAPADEGEPLVTAAPDEHSEVGALVAGFPTDLLPVPPDAVVLVTSAVPVGDAEVQEVSLNLRTAAAVQDVVALYRGALTEAGFTEVPPSALATTDLAAEVTFVRSGGDELVSIGVVDDGSARTVTVGGRVRTPA